MVSFDNKLHTDGDVPFYFPGITQSVPANLFRFRGCLPPCSPRHMIIRSVTGTVPGDFLYDPVILLRREIDQEDPEI
jgi:hypothetical protein